MTKRENKVDILSDLKRMIRSLNKYEVKKFIEILKNDKQIVSNYKILTNHEFENISLNLNEAYVRGFEDGLKEGVKNNELEQSNIENINKEETEEIFDEENLKNKLVELFNLMKF
jgi:hypothetical protein